jgi:peptidyl-prolyl cis-trans isomerase B (cyclophilin B)
MTKRQRERYTERNRPHRQVATRAATSATKTPDGFDNPIVLVAVGGLVLAIILALGVYFGRNAFNQTATTGVGTPVAEDATGAITDTQGITATVATDASAAAASYRQADDMKLDPAKKSYFAKIATTKGDVLVELWPSVAPKHVNSFVFLAKKGFYDGLTFHRVEDWVVQGGDPTGKGSGGPGYSVPAEFNADNPVPHSYGTFAMARSTGEDSAGSQFYFIKDPAGAPHLNGQYTVFGHVVKGMDVVTQLAQGDSMTSVTIEEKDASASMVSPDDIRSGKLPETPESASP